MKPILFSFSPISTQYDGYPKNQLRRNKKIMGQNNRHQIMYYRKGNIFIIVVWTQKKYVEQPNFSFLNHCESTTTTTKKLWRWRTIASPIITIIIIIIRDHCHICVCVCWINECRKKNEKRKNETGPMNMSNVECNPCAHWNCVYILIYSMMMMMMMNINIKLP